MLCHASSFTRPFATSSASPSGRCAPPPLPAKAPAREDSGHHGSGELLHGFRAFWDASTSWQTKRQGEPGWAGLRMHRGARPMPRRMK